MSDKIWQMGKDDEVEYNSEKHVVNVNDETIIVTLFCICLLRNESRGMRNAMSALTALETSSSYFLRTKKRRNTITCCLEEDVCIN